MFSRKANFHIMHQTSELPGENTCLNPALKMLEHHLTSCRRELFVSVLRNILLISLLQACCEQ